MLSRNIQLWIEGQLQQAVKEVLPVAGGCINEAYKLLTDKGEAYFLKVNSTAQMFYVEAAGLDAINAEVPRLAPQVVAVTEHALLLEYLEPARQSKSFWQSLGERLAQMHLNSKPYFGFVMDNYCGATPQPNPPTEDGFRFFAEHRLLHQTRLARDAQLLEARHCRGIEQLCLRLCELVPRQPAVLIHGDLWSGNVISSHRGACILDPACYYGWAEAELAMTTLFGGFDEAFYRSYQAAAAIADDWRDRADIYNLYHWLNHLNLFGGGYLSSVERVLARFI